MTARRDAVTDAGNALARARAIRDSLPPRLAAERAHVTSGPSVDEIETLIRVQRGQPEDEAA